MGVRFCGRKNFHLNSNFLYIHGRHFKSASHVLLKQPMKKNLFLISYNLLAICIFLFLLESSTRIFFPQIKPQGTDKNIYSENIYYDSHGLKPLSSGLSNGALVKINQYGFREYSTKIDTTKKSWLILGDSVTMGIGVEADSTFAGRLQTRNDSINILNPSIFGYAIKDYENLTNYFLIKRKNDFRISKIFLFWCLNDIYIDVPDFETPGGSLRHVLGDLLKTIRTKSRFYMLLKTLLFDRPKSYYLFDKKIYDSTRPELKNALKKLSVINRLAQNQQIDFTVILLPYEYQIRKLKSPELKPQRMMSSNFYQKGIEFFDPIYYLVDSKIVSKKIYLFGDGIHLSDLGHRLIADFVTQQQLY